jgi:hypothetical protein
LFHHFMELAMARPMALVTALLAIQAATLLAETPPASQPATTQNTTNAPASPLLTEVITAYMDGRFEALDKLLNEKAKDIGALPANEQNDITAIRQAVKDGRPDWWATTKAGTKGPLKISIWGRPLAVVFDPNTRYGANVSYTKEQKSLNVGWNGKDMDSTEKTSRNMTKGDLASYTAFYSLGNIEAAAQLPKRTLDNTIPQDRYLEFRGAVTAMVYGTPGARRYGMVLACTTYDEGSSKNQTRCGRRAIFAMFLSEVLANPDTYPSIKLPKTVTADKAEEELSLALIKILDKPLTYSEDAALRAALKSLAAANGMKAFTATAITLPNKLTVSLDPRTDDTPMAERNAWYKQQLEKRAAK